MWPAYIGGAPDQPPSPLEGPSLPMIRQSWGVQPATPEMLHLPPGVFLIFLVPPN